MNHSISTMTGKTKLKIILLGNQGVGKSSLIDQYINNRFEENYNVSRRWFSRLLESISWQKTSRRMLKTTAFNSGTLLDNRGLGLWFPAT